MVPAGVAVVLLDDEFKVLLGKRSTGNGAGSWGLPGGRLEEDESLEDCAGREVQEEVGLTTPPDYFIPILPVAHQVGDEWWVTIYMYGKITPIEKHMVKNCEPQKCEEIKWFTLEEVEDLMHVFGGEDTVRAIKDAILRKEAFNKISDHALRDHAH